MFHLNLLNILVFYAKPSVDIIKFPKYIPLELYSMAVMAYFHQRRWRRRWIPNPTVTLYYAQLFPPIRIRTRIRTRIPVQRLFPMVTVPILGMDLHPNKPVYTKFSCIYLHVFPFLNNKSHLQKWRSVVF